MRRRQVIGGALVAVGTGALAGCSALQSSAGAIHVAVFNHATTPFVLELTLFHADAETRSAARVFEASIEVAPEGEATRRAVVEQGPYLVRYEAYREDAHLTDEAHVHYVPPDGQDDDTLAFDIDEQGIVTRR